MKDNNSKLLIKNSAFLVVSKVVILIFGFVSRPILILYIGEELVGASSAISSLLSTLSLAELGFHASVIYRLYKPLLNQDYEECNQYISILNKLYRIIALFILVMVVALVPFLTIFLKGIVINSTIIIIFVLFGINSSLNYLYADKIQLFYADKRDYIEKKIELCAELVFNILALVIVILFRNYILYVSLMIIKTIISGIIISYISRIYYPWLRIINSDKKYKKNIFNDIKYLSLANFAGYVYFNTDNLVISSFVGAVEVLYFTNYTNVTVALNNLADLTIRQIEPFIAERYNNNSNGKHNFPILMTDSFIRFCMSDLIIVPIYILLPTFVSWWVGEKYIMSNILLILLCIDMYIFIVHRVFSDYIAITGSYKYESKLSFVGAIINLCISIILVNLWGIEGVLVGTIISNIFFWISRGYVVMHKLFDLSYKETFYYITHNIAYVICFMITLLVNCVIVGKIHLDIFILSFVIKGMIVEVINLLIISAMFFHSKEYRCAMDYIKGRNL